MKTQFFKPLSLLLATVISLGIASPRLTSGQSCCGVAPGQAVDTLVTGYQSPDSYFVVQVISPTTAIPLGSYSGWCAEEFVDIPLFGNTGQNPASYNGKIYMSCDPNINTYLANEPAALNGNWQAVNWILNHKTGYSWSDVQAAIWYFVGSGQSPKPTPYPVTAPYPPGAPYPFVPPSYTSTDQGLVDALVVQATANSPSWTPQCGVDKIAAILLFDTPTADLQLLFIEVTCPCPTPPPLSLTCQGGSGQVGQPFTSQLGVSGGTAPFTYTISAGSLPSGLTLNPSTGLIYGTPTAAGSFSFTAQVTDSSTPVQTAFSTCSGGCTPAACTTTWDFSNPSGCLGVSQTYIAGGLTITAYGYDGSGHPVKLYGKTGGGDENGLGLCGQKDNEITVNHYVVLDLIDLINKNAQNAQMWIGSAQKGELYDIAGSSDGSHWTPLLTGQNLDYTLFAIPGYPAYRYISVTANGSKNCYANVLLGAVSVDCVGACTITIAPPPPPPHNCTYTIGYYKNHPSAITPLPVYLGTLGGAKTLVVDTQQKGVDVLSQNVYCSPSDGITKLYAQLLAAKLNIANGADGSAIASVIAAADAFLAIHNCNDWSSLKPSDACLVLVWQCALDSYNNGNIGPGHCGDSTCNTGGQNGGDDGSDNGGKNCQGSNDNGQNNNGGKNCQGGNSNQGNNGWNGGNGYNGGANCQSGNGGQGNDHSGNQGNNQNGGNGNNNCNNNGGHH